MHSEGEQSAMASEGAGGEAHLAFPSLEATLPCCTRNQLEFECAPARWPLRIRHATNASVASPGILRRIHVLLYFPSNCADSRSVRGKESEWYSTRPEKKALNHLPRHQGELNGREKCKYGGGAGEVVGKGGVGLLVVFHLGLEGLEEEHPGMEVVLPVAASPPLPSRERGRFHWHHMHTCHCHGFNNSHLFPLFGSMLDSIIESV